jgi:pyrroloquinoline-quinone synthase
VNTLLARERPIELASFEGMTKSKYSRKIQERRALRPIVFVVSAGFGTRIAGRRAIPCAIPRERRLMTTTTELLSDRETFAARLRDAGKAKYREAHPLVADMEAGRATPAAVKRWIAARFYLQSLMPRQDARIVANSPIRDVRRAWVERILEHDGRRADQGAIGAWTQLGEASGVARRYLEEHHLMPTAVRLAIDEQLDLVDKAPWPAAVASTLVDLVAPDLLREPIEAFEAHYTWIDRSALGYFRARTTQTARNAAYSLECAGRYCDTPGLQRQAVETLRRKCELLWLMLDAAAEG